MDTTPSRLQAMVLVNTEIVDREEYRRFAEGISALGKGTVDIKCDVLFGVYDIMASVYSDTTKEMEETIMAIQRLPYVRSVMANPVKGEGFYFCNDW